MAGTNAGAGEGTNNNLGTGAGTAPATQNQNVNGGANGNGGNGGGNGEQKTASQIFDEALKQEGQQAEFDRRLNKALETQKANLTADVQKRIDDAVAEALKKEKMNDDEKAAYAQKEAEKALAEREAEITKREVKASARDILAEKKLPAGLIDIVDCSSEAAMEKSIEIIEKTFAPSVETSVNERLKGGKVPDKAKSNSNDDLLAQVRKFMS